MLSIAWMRVALCSREVLQLFMTEVVEDWIAQRQRHKQLQQMTKRQPSTDHASAIKRETMEWPIPSSSLI